MLDVCLVILHPPLASWLNLCGNMILSSLHFVIASALLPLRRLLFSNPGGGHLDSWFGRKRSSRCFD